MNHVLSMMIRPRETMRQIKQFDTMKTVQVIAFAFAGVVVFNQIDPEASLFHEIAMRIIGVGAGFLAIMLSILIMSGLLHMVGRLFGGRGSTLQLRLLEGYCMGPLFLFYIIAIGDFASSIVHGQSFLEYHLLWGNPVLAWLFIALSVISGMWYWIISIFALSEVQEFPLWNAALNYLIAMAIVLVPLYVLVWLGGRYYGI